MITLCMVPLTIMNEGWNMAILPFYGFFLYKWWVLIKLGDREVNLIPFLAFPLAIYYGKKAFLITYHYIILAFTNQTFKEKEIRDKNNMDVDITKMEV